MHLSGDKRTVVDEPFAETKELIGGFWLWQVKSMDEAIEWVKRCPNPYDADAVFEIRPVFESEALRVGSGAETHARAARIPSPVAAR